MSTRVLIVGCRAPGALEGSYARALGRCGCDVSFFETMPKWLFAVPARSVVGRLCRRGAAEWLSRRASQRLIRFVSQRSRAFDVILVFKGVEFERDELVEIRQMTGARLVNINADDPF